MLNLVAPDWDENIFREVHIERACSFLERLWLWHTLRFFLDKPMILEILLILGRNLSKIRYTTSAGVSFCSVDEEMKSNNVRCTQGYLLCNNSMMWAQVSMEKHSSCGNICLLSIILSVLSIGFMWSRRCGCLWCLRGQLRSSLGE